MSEFNWQKFLKRESRKAIEDYQQVKSQEKPPIWASYFEFPSEVISSEWLGFPGASEEQIVAAETRLGVTLPPSYRDFLKVTNGWRDSPGTLKFRSTEEIDWFCVESQDWIDEWNYLFRNQEIGDEEYFSYGQGWKQKLRIEYMQTALQISDYDDGDVFLLNPQIIHHEEWEAWILSTHYGGAKRFRSFQEMLQTIGMVNHWA